MQAAQTVKQSDPSYSGWSAAAAQFRKAEAAFRAANDLVQAAAAAEQAQTLENALKIADQKAGQVVATNPPPTVPQADAASAGQPSNACPAKAPAGYWQSLPDPKDAAYCANANCVDRGSALYGYLCFPPSPATSNVKPEPDPQQLGLLARNACGSYSRDTAQCFGDTKFKSILAARPDIEDFCRKNTAGYSKLRDQLSANLGSAPASIDPFVVCVDDVYLHGFPTPLRERLANSLSMKPVTVYPPGSILPVNSSSPMTVCGMTVVCRDRA